MQGREEALRMLAQARKDATALGGMGDPAVFADEVYGFHAQQAAEKALKAWLTLRRVEYPKTHDLASLLHLLEQSGQSTSALAGLVELSGFSVQFRYEAFDSADEPLDRPAVQRRVLDLLGQVQNLAEHSDR
jgi:HEPN domain-containing protein